MEKTNKKKCLIIGAGTYGQVYANYLREEYDVIGFIDDNDDLIGKAINGILVLGNTEFVFNELDKNVSIFVPIGSNSIRVKLLKKLKKNNFSIPSFIHKATQIEKTVKIGENAVYILPSTNIMPYTSIGDFTMISIGVNIAHHTYIEEGCFFSQGVNVGASINIKNGAYCGIGSTIMTGVKNIGKNSLIGAGAVIIKDVPDGAKVVGNPGRII